MRCTSCHHQSNDQAKFCEQCGMRLARTCGTCGAEVSAGARFCGACGAVVSDHAAAPSAAPPTVSHTAERRQVTVVFCDLVESTALSQRIDPEDLGDLVRGYHEVCAREIRRVGGHIGQYLGDGVVAYFGFPVAHEQDAQAAVRAGLAVVETMEREVDPRARLAVRVGIHTGLVVADEIGPLEKREIHAVGSTPNVASRVQGVARPNSVVISEATHRLVREFFHCTDLGPQEMKGVFGVMRVYEVRGDSGMQSRLDGAVEGSLTALTGRDLEVDVLRERWDSARGGRGQVVLVSGEAGLGKSRLLQELKERIAGAGALRLECRCAPHFESSAFYPVIDLLQRLWELRTVASVDEKIARIELAVAAQAAEAPDSVPLLASLLSIPVSDRYPPLDLTPQRQKQKTLEALVEVLAEMASRQPVLFAVEDLHWIDPSSLELLHLVVARVPATRIMAVFLFRPTFEAPWHDGEHLTRIDLGRLAPDETARMIGHVAGGRDLPPEVVRDLSTKTDGVPLYVEELTKAVLESGVLRERGGRYELSRPLSELAVPVTLQESLMARLDRLAPLKEVVQLGATIGRAFSYDLIRAVSPLDEATLQTELARLVDAEVLHLRGTPPALTYVFKHALIQDAAYESLLRNKRREYHRRIAVALTAQTDVVATQPELLGHHWAGAGEAASAIVAYHRAGQRAFERSAYTEASSHLRRALGICDAITDTFEREQYELQLLVALGPVLVGTLGYSNPDVETVYARARDLCERVGDARLRYTVLSGLLLFHQSRAEIAECVELTKQRLVLAQELAEPALEMLVHENFGTLDYWVGQYERALASLRRAQALYEPKGGRRMRLMYGTDSAVVCASYEGHSLWFRGYPDQALRVDDHAVRIARELGEAHSLALALAFAAGLRINRREPEETLRFAEEVIAISTEQQLAQWKGSGLVSRGIALAEMGRAEEGVAAMFEGLTVFQATGARIAGRYFVAMLADAHLRAGRAQDGLAFLDATLPILASCEDVFWDSEVARTRAELLLAFAADEPAPIEAHLREALALSRNTDSKILELRAAVSLARFLGRHGRSDEGHAILAPVHAWFTEGFDTVDLRQAAEVLADLSPQPVAAGLTARTST
jgi:class 3 adenylate cyclase/predicted ATPase